MQQQVWNTATEMFCPTVEELTGAWPLTDMCAPCVILVSDDPVTATHPASLLHPPVTLSLSHESLALMTTASNCDISQSSSHNGRKRKKRRKNKEMQSLRRNMYIAERRSQVMFETNWMPIADDSQLGSSTVVTSSPDMINADVNNTTPTPTASAAAPMTSSHSDGGRRHVTVVTPVQQRCNPLPVFEWADSREMWQTMMAKEELPGYRRADVSLVQPTFRLILLDWLMEVCASFNLRRETFHTTVDFVDRYLSRVHDVSKDMLQLVGVSSLFVAAKVEEIHPVRVADLSFVTGGSCTSKAILDQERHVLSTLRWELTPLTVVSWVSVFLQTISVDQDGDRKSRFMTPQYSQHAFVQVMRLLDTCVLDADCLRYSYSVLAASAISLTYSPDVALSVSGYQWSDIDLCVQWMQLFATVLDDIGPTLVPNAKCSSRVTPSECHTVQTHVVSRNTVEAVYRRRQTDHQSNRHILYHQPPAAQSVITYHQPPDVSCYITV